MMLLVAAAGWSAARSATRVAWPGAAVPHVNAWRTSRPICSIAPIAANLASIQQQVSAAAAAAGRSDEQIRLVAVSKTKPTELLQAAYDAGVRDFGENYVQELVAKAPELPVDISWRFIGKVQSNKAKSLVHGVPSLSVVETVDTPKLANKLQAAVESMSPARASQLGVMVQVNTSPQEGTKGGVLAADAPALAAHIRDACPDLCLTGLMTIGAPGDMSCFDTLSECRNAVASSLGIDATTLELSMGMSADFEEAISRGSTSVRVGSSIFGARDYPSKA